MWISLSHGMEEKGKAAGLGPDHPGTTALRLCAQLPVAGRADRPSNLFTLAGCPVS